MSYNGQFYRTAFKSSRQSEIDRLHPLLRGATALWLFDEGAGRHAFDRVGMSQTNATSVVPARVAARFGRGVKFTGSEYFLFLSHDGISFANVMSFSMWLRTTSTSNTVIFEKSSNNTNYHLHMSSVTAGALQFGNTTTNRVNSKKLVSDGRWHHGVGVLDTRITTTKIYIDGVLDNTNASATDAFSTNTIELLVGSRTGSFGFPGEIDQLIFYNRALTDGEVRHLYREPLAFLKPQASRRYWYYGVPAAAASDTDSFVTWG